jgi:hypothetical protein
MVKTSLWKISPFSSLNSTLQNWHLVITHRTGWDNQPIKSYGWVPINVWYKELLTEKQPSFCCVDTIVDPSWSIMVNSHVQYTYWSHVKSLHAIGISAPRICWQLRDYMLLTCCYMLAVSLLIQCNVKKSFSACAYMWDCPQCGNYRTEYHLFFVEDCYW